MFSFMSHFKLFLSVLLLCPLYLSCKDKGVDFSRDEFLITSNGDEESTVAADYLYQHMSGRAGAAKSLNLIRSDENLSNYHGERIYLEVVPEMDHDFEIKNGVHSLAIFGKDRSVLRWLSYMLIDHISKFQPLEVADLPPAYIDFEDRTGSFAFRYREPHFLPNLDENNLGILNTHSIEREWGIWGHNLYKVLPQDLPSDAYALVDGKRNRQQYCFSSNTMFQALERFISDHYGVSESKWFMIAPNDNDLVCSCSKCRKLGNKPGEATAGVVALLNRLATRYPSHHFFTMAYRTTKNAPSTQTNKNVGVFISTIDLPTQGDLDLNDAHVQAFSSLVNDWRKQSHQLFLWDYVSNFDDYLTPYPVLSRTKSHLRFFQSLGCQGIFMNGSGYDYSSFDDVKTYVLSALMIDMQLSVEKLVTNYFKRFYPVTASLLTSYYLQLERRAEKENSAADIYTGFYTAKRNYFDSEKFLELFKDIKRLEPQTNGVEKLRLAKLITAMNYTSLQICYQQGFRAGGFMKIKDEELVIANTINEALLGLEKNQGKGGVSIYKEEEGQLSIYCHEWRDQLERPHKINKIAGLSVLSADGEHENSHFLFDNVLGFRSDFNQGWFQCSADIVIDKIFFRPFKQTQHLSIRFLLNERHRMLPPEAIEIFVNDRFVDRISTSDLDKENGLMILNKDLRINENEKLYIKIYKNRTIRNSVIACDEIQLF
mgnify:CR=1 FL=1